jgi:serine/threonine protein phosphatase PrpC
MLRPPRLLNAVLPLLLLIVPASFMTLASTRSYSMASANDDGCPPYGCPLFPLDVIGSEHARTGIDVLRRQVGTSQEYTEIMASIKSAGDEDKVLLTLMGYKGGSLKDQINQDSATIFSPFYVNTISNTVQLLGVFDGHGKLGEITADHAAKEIPRLVGEQLRRLMNRDPWTPLKDEVVKQVLKDAFIGADQSDPTFGVGGATATVMLQLGHKIYVANAGDSRSFIGVHADGTTHLVYASREDKPDLPDERQRITEAGGYVHIPNQFQHDVPRAYYIDPQGNPRFGLAMSRTIGDWKVQGVIAEPIVDVVNVAAVVNQAIHNHTEACRTQKSYNLRTYTYYEEKLEDACQPLDPSEVHVFAISASDGMLDYLEPSEIAHEMAMSFFDKGGKHPFVAAEHLIITAAEGWDTENRGRYRDDITISACKIFVNERIMADGNRAMEEERDEL